MGYRQGPPSRSVAGHHGPSVQFPTASTGSDSTHNTLSSAPARARRSHRRTPGAPATVAAPMAGVPSAGMYRGPYDTNPFASAPGMASGHNPSYAAFEGSAAPSSRRRTDGSSRPGKTVSSTSSSSSHITATRGLPANTFRNRLTDALKGLGVSELVPLTAYAIANVMHRRDNRDSEHLVPYQTPYWMRYVKHVTLAISFYRWLKSNGIVNVPPKPSKSDGKKDADKSRSRSAHPGGNHKRSGRGSGHHRSKETMHNSYDANTHHVDDYHGSRSLQVGNPMAEYHGGGGMYPSYPMGGYQGGFDPYMMQMQQQQFYDEQQRQQFYEQQQQQQFYEQQQMQQPEQHQPTEAEFDEFMMQVMQQIVGSLFRVKPNKRGSVEEFDTSWAMPKHLAEEHYRNIYRHRIGLRGVKPHVLGGAAAIKALRSERQMMSYHGMQQGVSDPGYKQDFMLLGLALTEVHGLLNRKADANELGPDDFLENVGKFAIATIIKIKLDEDKSHPFPYGSVPFASAALYNPAAANNPAPGYGASARGAGVSGATLYPAPTHGAASYPAAPQATDPYISRTHGAGHAHPSNPAAVGRCGTTNGDYQHATQDGIPPHGIPNF
ncbi:hypothetical protein LPJ61_001982 [Coemansia biformis]|uniref:Uncharacterized protein n=1 Tax=Coemansia biformis TaxID=1286918 RepID=A0A9W8CWU2_9FUNG|nr:hypothetical protein LPJ61_001982 [Coemansia biformis]